MSDYWSKTGELFKTIIEKPKMVEKFLKKPPPKYIYDMIMNTMKATGFPKGLFTDEEMDPKFFEADPRNKLEIFQKVIEISKIVTNENFEIKCTNILKGEEPDKTNYFLQMFFKAATNGKDNSKFIQKYLEHRKKKAEEKKKKEAEPSQSKQEAPKKQEPQREQPAPEKKQIVSQPTGAPKKAPKGIILENDDKEPEVSSNDQAFGSETKTKKGTGMKFEKHIFMHDSVMDEDGKKEQAKTKVSKVDLEAIKTHVQEITKNSNPIGKIIEFIGDDIDMMNKELQNWIKESKSYKERYDEEIKKSDETLLPLQNELLELEDSIRDEQMQIKSIKSRLIKNEKIIQNLITNVISFKNDQAPN